MKTCIFYYQETWYCREHVWIHLRSHRSNRGSIITSLYINNNKTISQFLSGYCFQTHSGSWKRILFYIFPSLGIATTKNWFFTFCRYTLRSILGFHGNLDFLLSGNLLLPWTCLHPFKEPQMILVWEVVPAPAKASRNSHKKKPWCWHVWQRTSQNANVLRLVYANGL